MQRNRRGLIRTARATVCSLIMFSALILSPTARAAASAGPCVGDCNADGVVSVFELVLSSRIALAREDIPACEAIDVDGNGLATIDELIAAVVESFTLCGAVPPPTATNTRIKPTNTPTRTPTKTPTMGPAAQCFDVGCASCCRSSCQDDGDCCPGTRCLDLTSGQGRACFPTSCDSCFDVGQTCSTDPETCQVECVPPPPPSCCGDSCNSDGDCCTGTTCGRNTGRCIPDSCSVCFNAGLSCSTDVEQCTARCNPPPSPTPVCCGASCTSDADCCQGSTCGSSTRRCIPDSCQSCFAIGQSCSTDFATCTINCVPPPPPSCCLDDCNGDGDCCQGTSCLESASGGRKCFPDGCDLCSTAGLQCRVSGEECSFSCVQRPVPTATPIPTPTPFTGPCVGCCEPCGGSTRCCPGTLCGPDGICIPNECAACGAGFDCDFRCP